MEVDPPSSNNISTPIHNPNPHHGLHSHDLESAMNGNGIPAPGALKRSSSAPMINILVSTSALEISPPNTFTSADSQRTRRFSSSSMTLHNAALTPVKIADRLNQLKHEESEIVVRDIQKEREIRSAIQISNSWNEKISIDEPMIADSTHRRPRSFSESLHIFTSPTMIIVEPDGDSRLDYMSPPKKFHTGPSTPDRLLPHPLAHSVSSSSCEGSSPEQTIPRAASIHNARLSSGMQPNMFFMPLQDTQEMQTTDSETSDVTESTDMSEVGESSSSGLLLTAAQGPSHGVVHTYSSHL
ncbi:F122A-like protein [Mya arenaria]|uniref:F122A-like protein n=1 Tax=Mya arenaria TaxID=6604 RepID=A0ABY7G2R8_MYAAR|nr:F122A-like protein [Mya arenaria]